MVPLWRLFGNHCQKASSEDPSELLLEQTSRTDAKEDKPRRRGLNEIKVAEAQ